MGYHSLDFDFQTWLPDRKVDGIFEKRAPAEHLYINESLTQYRGELFGRVNKFKKENKYKFLWTNNGKIYLCKHETSQTLTFTTFQEFEDFIAPSQ